jgi:O-antigen/teichoic acid export membrane protein
MALLGWGAALPGVLLAGVVVRLLFGPAYATTAPMFAVLLLAYPFLASAIAREQILIAERKPMRLLAAMGLGVVSNVGLNLLLIPRLGGLGAAIASLGTQIAAGVLSSFVFADTREIGRWQIRALFGRKRPPDVAASALP